MFQAMMTFGTARSVTMLSGYAPAIPTPFDRNGSLDGTAFAQLCERLVQHGATGLVVCATTGEAPTLSAGEQERIVRVAVDVASHRVPVIAGAGCNSTAHAIELAKAAEAAGADAILSVVPYYNKPSQAGLLAHFRAIADSIGLPIILYDVPSRTSCGLADETVAELAENAQFIGLKDATADIARPARLRALVRPEFRLLSGDDATALAFLAMGGDGCISVTSNVAPGLCRDMFDAFASGRTSEAQGLAPAVARLTAALFRETNPVPVKYALSLFGLMSPQVRLPLVQAGRKVEVEIALVVEEISDKYPDRMIGALSSRLHERRKAVAA
jgi:4-hydroxy-tetrahydrodipicolinate synthase